MLFLDFIIELLRVKRFQEFFIGIINRDTYALMNDFDQRERYKQKNRSKKFLFEF